MYYPDTTGGYCWVFSTVFPHISYFFLASLIAATGITRKWYNTKFHLHKSVPCEGIIRNADIIRGRALYEEIRYAWLPENWYMQHSVPFWLILFYIGAKLTKISMQSLNPDHDNEKPLSIISEASSSSIETISTHTGILEYFNIKE